MQASETAKTTDVDLAMRYRAVREHTERLCEPLKTEDYIPQPIADVSPARWNIAHTTWFFEEMILRKFVSNYKVFDESFGFLFNSYYNTIGERTPRDRRCLSRPTVAEIWTFREHVDREMLELIDWHTEPANWTDPPGEPLLNPGDELYDLVVLGINHEQQHQELLLSDLKYTFSVNPLFPAYRLGYVPEEMQESWEPSFIKIDESIYEVGLLGDQFSFDNERPRHPVYVREFEICDHLVTNGEFLEFILAGGYRDHRFWHAEGWDWVNQNAIDSPLYWHKLEGEWSHFTLGGLRKLPLDAPVCHVSFYEASAFAEWKGMRLPTEFEWEVANEQFNWGKRWEWTNSAYLPYPGFAKAAGAVGEYNGKFMINQMVLRGASAITPAGHSRPSYRNFFHPHLRWQFTGIRLAK
jgi:ergothioneine biosynthesis protein EgtB